MILLFITWLLLEVKIILNLRSFAFSPSEIYRLPNSIVNKTFIVGDLQRNFKITFFLKQFSLNFVLKHHY